MKNDLEELLYDKLCHNCPRAKKCHDECEHCDDFWEQLGILEDLERENDNERM